MAIMRFFKRSSRPPTIIETAHDYLKILYPPDFTKVHSPKFSLETLTVLFTPIDLYTQHLVTLLRLYESNLTIYKRNYSHNASVCTLSEFFLSPSGCYGKEKDSITEFIAVAAQFINCYEIIERLDPSDYTPHQLIIQKVAKDLIELIKSLHKIQHYL